jgi:hypothetical protein
MSAFQNFKNFLNRELRGKLRVWLSWIVVPLILWNVRRTPELGGILVLFAGALLRFWASGCLRKEGQLCVMGPYRFSRNPLYLGSILISVAIPISQQAWGLTAFVFVISLLMFYPLIGREEAVLTEKFGAAYQEYLRTVPRLFSPLALLRAIFTRNKDQHSFFSWELWKKNKGWEPLLVAAGMLLVSCLMPSLWKATGRPDVNAPVSAVGESNPESSHS